MPNTEDENSAVIREIAREEVERAFYRDGPNVKSLKLDLLRYAGLVALGFLGAAGAAGFYFVNDVAEETATAAASSEAARIAQAVATEEARQTANSVGVATIVSALADDASFSENVSARLLNTLDGSVLAFDLDDGCPAGWTPYHQASGRFVIGAVSEDELGRIPGDFREDARSADLVARPFGQPGGEQQVALAIDQMPSHTHQFVGMPEPVYGRGALLNNLSVGDGINHDERAYTPRGTITPEGGDQPHNNMPPYIALYYCKKD